MGASGALLANLLIAAGDAVPADRLIDAVWGDALPSNPANTLQHGVAQLRKLLEPGRTRSDPPQVLISEGAGYRLDLDGHAADMDEFSVAVDSGREALERGDARRAVKVLSAALAVWRGPAYADFAYADFARAESERPDELRIQCRELLVDARSAATGPESVIADLEGLVVEYPYREGLWSRLMRVLYQTGRQAEALRVYADAGRVLGDELGIAPSTELQELEEQILLQDPSLASAQRRAPRHNLPAVTTSLIGRAETLAQVLDFLETARLTTLLGPGRVGQDPPGDRSGPPVGGRLRRRCVAGSARRSGRYRAAGGHGRLGGRDARGSAQGGHRDAGQTICRTSGRCWSSTTASTSSNQSPAWPTRCWPPAHRWSYLPPVRKR